MAEYKTGEARFNVNGEARYFIERVGGEDYPRVRLYGTTALRDTFAKQYRAGEPWSIELGNPAGETSQPWGQSNYTLVSYDEPEQQFRLFYNTEHPDGFIITNSKDPGRHWQGIFGGVHVRGLDTVNRFRDGDLAWDYNQYRRVPMSIGQEYIVPTTKPVWAEPTAEQQLENLWNALAAEAKERGWCDEFDTFAAANGAPERLFKSKIQVTLEIEVPTREPDTYDVARALDINENSIKNWEAIA